MEGALIILFVTVAVGVILWAWEKMRGGKPLHHHSPAAEDSENAENNDNNQTAICCGLHAICEKTGQINDPPVYYDDEQLDKYIGKDPAQYSDDEIEEFRDVLLTLMPSDAPGWSVSLQKRRISLPSELQPELELLLSEL